jgi:hypothetical protein
MTSDEFEETIDNVAKIVDGLHKRLMRIEEWMLKQEKKQESQKSCRTTDAKKK